MMMIADDDSREPAGWAPRAPAAPGDAHEDLLPALPLRALQRHAGLQVSTVQYSTVQYNIVQYRSVKMFVCRRWRAIAESPWLWRRMEVVVGQMKVGNMGPRVYCPTTERITLIWEATFFRNSTQLRELAPMNGFLFPILLRIFQKSS